MTVDELRRLKGAAPAAGAAFAIVAALAASSLLARRAPVAELPPHSAMSVGPASNLAEPALPVESAERVQPAGARLLPPQSVAPSVAPSFAPATPPSRPPSRSPSSPPSGAPPTPAADQIPPSLPGEEVALVVKFKDDGKIKEVVDLFWKDQRAARAKYDRFKSGRPELAETALDRVTYSNELVLIHDRPMPPAALAARMRVIADRLRASPDIAYAEADATAHPDDRR